MPRHAVYGGGLMWTRAVIRGKTVKMRSQGLVTSYRRIRESTADHGDSGSGGIIIQRAGPARVRMAVDWGVTISRRGPGEVE